MSKLDNLKEQYAKLGEEIKKLEVSTTEVLLAPLPSKFDVHVPPLQMTWQGAMDYAESIGMRLPTKIELQAIAMSTSEFDEFGFTWSSCRHHFGVSDAWSVHLYSRRTDHLVKTNYKSVLCIAE